MPLRVCVNNHLTQSKACGVCGRAALGDLNPDSRKRAIHRPSRKDIGKMIVSRESRLWFWKTKGKPAYRSAMQRREATFYQHPNPRKGQQRGSGRTIARRAR